MTIFWNEYISLETHCVKTHYPLPSLQAWGPSQNRNAMIPSEEGPYHGDVFMVIVSFTCHPDDLRQCT